MTIFIPTPLRQFAGGKDTVAVSASTVAGALDELTQAHPDLRKHLFTDEGKVRAFVNVYLNDEDVRYLPEKDATKVSPTDTLSIIPSIAGGGPAARAIAPSAQRACAADGNHQREREALWHQQLHRPHYLS
jgi:molybdopterin converting factor small subunit